MVSRVPLEESWLFQGLPSGVLERIRELATEQHFEAGTAIFSEGDPARDLYILGEGEVELTIVLPSREPVTMRIAHIKPGEVFGWSALARGEKLTADAIAVSDARAYVIPAAPLIEILDRDPPTGYRVMIRLAQLIAKRLRDTRAELRWIQSYI